jgi:hypothetical protein
MGRSSSIMKKRYKEENKLGNKSQKGKQFKEK